jgi:hypothetical protein
LRFAAVLPFVAACPPVADGVEVFALCAARCATRVATAMDANESTITMVEKIRLRISNHLSKRHCLRLNLSVKLVLTATQIIRKSVLPTARFNEQLSRFYFSNHNPTLPVETGNLQGK